MRIQIYPVNWKEHFVKKMIKYPEHFHHLLTNHDGTVTSETEGHSPGPAPSAGHNSIKFFPVFCRRPIVVLLLSLHSKHTHQ